MRAARINAILARSAATARPEIRQLVERLSDEELFSLELSNEAMPLRCPDLAADLPLDRLTRLTFRGRPDLLARSSLEKSAIFATPR